MQILDFSSIGNLKSKICNYFCTSVTRQLSFKLSQKFQTVTKAIAISVDAYGLMPMANSKFTIKVCKIIPARQIMLNFSSVNLGDILIELNKIL